MFPLSDVRTILGIAYLVLLPSVTAASADSAFIESAITGWVLPAVLAFIMFTIGVDLEFADFVRVARHPTALAVGLLNQIILLPVTAYVIAIALALPPSLAVGIMILAACPGGPTSNLWTKIAKGDVPLSVSFTAVNSILSMVTVPIIVNIAFHRFMGPEAASLASGRLWWTMLLMATLPVLAGMSIRWRDPRLADRVKPPLERSGFTMFVIIIIVGTIVAFDLIMTHLRGVLLACLILLCSMLAIGMITGAMFRLLPEERTAVAIETAIQNSTVGITVAGLAAPSATGISELALVPAGYGFVMYGVAGPFTGWRRRARTHASTADQRNG